MISERYDPKAIEGKWQQVWENKKVFKAPAPHEDAAKRPKYYCLCMFPYPSGNIHMGHLRNYCIGDVISRFKRMKGFNVMQPVGWDAFGLPAENAAIQRGVHPRGWTLENIAQMKIDLKSMGIAYDWDREIATCLPDYYKWEQLFFQRFYKEGLAYRKKGSVNWCENCQTVMANEQVQDGKCWRCDGPIILKELSQWYLKITKYADQLLSGHEQLGQWPPRIIEMQKHWIGESRGCRIQFPLENGKDKIEVFTTRPDTLFGVSFVTIAPGHPWAATLCTDDSKRETLEVLKAEVQARPKDVVATTKKGFFTGSYAKHPITDEKVPVWVGDFVVMDYGTGAVMGVPAHDERDFEFAAQYGLPVKFVVQPKDPNAEKTDGAYLNPGVLVASGEFTGLDNETAKTKIGEKLEQKKLGTPTTQYRLRDWGISRQRYWGAPIPVIYCEKDGLVLVPEKDLPVELPADVQFKGLTGNPLERHDSFVNVKCPTCGGPAKRETDTMDTFVESSWYYARYVDPKNDKLPFAKSLADEWLPVDTYIGGAEHACMHLLYSRFFHKVLRDWGYLSGDEPFKRLLAQGMVIKDGAKMSKSKGNVVSLTSIIEKYGTDTGRLFSLFAAPPEKDLEWNDKGVEGCHRFLQRVWRLSYQFKDVLAAAPPAEPKDVDGRLLTIRKKTHSTIHEMGNGIEQNKFNTAISFAMELVNELYGALTESEKVFESDAGKFVLREALHSLVLMLAPFAPHLCEELWAAMGHSDLIANVAWPAHRPEFLVNDTFTLVVQVNGKVRDKVEIAKSLGKEEIEKMVLAMPKVQQFMEGKPVRKFVYVPERIANVVVG